MLWKITSLTELFVDDIIVKDENQLSKKFTVKSIRHEFVRMVNNDGKLIMKILPLEQLVDEGWLIERK